MADPRFELHIRPMMRAMDRDHMASRFDLWRYEDIVSHAHQLVTRLASDMPTPSSGGPWPPEWVELFRRWQATGYKRLELGNANFTLIRSGSRHVLTAEGLFPGAGYRGWLQLDDVTNDVRTYHLFFDAPDAPAAGAPSPFSMRERYPASDLRRVVVRTAAGPVDVAVEPAAPAFLALDVEDDLTFYRDQTG